MKNQGAATARAAEEAAMRLLRVHAAELKQPKHKPFQRDAAELRKRINTFLKQWLEPQNLSVRANSKSDQRAIKQALDVLGHTVWALDVITVSHQAMRLTAPPLRLPGARGRAHAPPVRDLAIAMLGHRAGLDARAIRSRLAAVGIAIDVERVRQVLKDFGPERVTKILEGSVRSRARALFGPLP